MPKCNGDLRRYCSIYWQLNSRPDDPSVVGDIAFNWLCGRPPLGSEGRETSLPPRNIPAIFFFLSAPAECSLQMVLFRLARLLYNGLLARLEFPLGGTCSKRGVRSFYKDEFCPYNTENMFKNLFYTEFNLNLKIVIPMPSDTIASFSSIPHACHHLLNKARLAHLTLSWFWRLLKRGATQNSLAHHCSAHIAPLTVDSEKRSGEVYLCALNPNAASTLRSEVSNSRRAVPLRAVDSLLGRDTAPSSEAVLRTDMRRLRLLSRSSEVVSLSSPAMVRPKSEPPRLLEDVRT